MDIRIHSKPVSVSESKSDTEVVLTN